jgi:predicted RNA binding protein YcfA (HicA-like mRNA interferase family)
MSHSQLPKASGREHVKAFERLGWRFRRQTASHIILVKPGVNAILSVPDHDEVAMGTLARLVKDSGASPEEYRNAFGGSKGKASSS